MVQFSLYFFFKCRSKFLIFNWMSNIIQELENFMQIDKLAHSFKELLNSNHMISAVPLLILYLEVIQLFESNLFYLIQRTDSMNPQIFLFCFWKSASILITDFNNLHDHIIESYDVVICSRRRIIKLDICIDIQSRNYLTLAQINKYLYI